MKKILALACIVVCVFALGACGANEAELETETTVSEQAVTAPRVTTTTTRQMSEDEWVAQYRVIPDVLPEFDRDSMKLSPIEEILGEFAGGSPYDFEGPLQFRYCYYVSYGSFWTLVDSDEYDEWVTCVPPPEDFAPNGTADEMPLVTLVKYFRVPKHVFVAEVERKREHYTKMGDDLSMEINELPNPDIIYTFDNDIINAYYSR